MFSTADADHKNSGKSYEYPGGETLYERLTEKTFNDDTRWPWGDDRFVHHHLQTQGAGSKFDPYAKRDMLVEYDRSSPACHVRLPQESGRRKCMHERINNKARHRSDHHHSVANRSTHVKDST